jgi:type I restriction enzyme, R subunit
MALQKGKGYQYYERFRNLFQEFREECKNIWILCELRILNPRSAASIHDRWLISENKSFNIPSIDTVKIGHYSEIKKIENAPPFDDFWDQSKDIMSYLDEIRRELINKVEYK